MTTTERSPSNFILHPSSFILHPFGVDHYHHGALALEPPLGDGSHAGSRAEARANPRLTDDQAFNS
jgi:hypothetical protein